MLFLISLLLFFHTIFSFSMSDPIKENFEARKKVIVAQMRALLMPYKSPLDTTAALHLMGDKADKPKFKIWDAKTMCEWEIDPIPPVVALEKLNTITYACEEPEILENQLDRILKLLKFIQEQLPEKYNLL